MEMLTRAATSTGGTAVIATDTPVKRRDSRGLYFEILDPAGAEWPDKVPLRDTHRTDTVLASLGWAENIRREGSEIVADVVFTETDDVAPYRQRWADGTVTSVSVGYHVLELAESNENGRRVKRAVQWRLIEVSLVANPADPKARKRMKDTFDRAEVLESTRMALGLPDTWGDDLPDDATMEDIRTAAREAVQTRQVPRVRVGRDHTDPATIIRRQSDAMSYRMAGGTLPDDAREFVSLSLKDIAADALTRAGVSTRGLSADDIFQRAAQTTSDYPLVVSNAVNKVALEAFKAAESPLKQLSRQRTLSNFKESTSIRVGEAGPLEELSESGEIVATSRAETGETMRLSIFARRLDVSRKLMIDDDLNLLGDTTAALGQSAAQTESNGMVSLLVDNPALRDGTAVFHASRGNLSTGAALSVASLGLARRAMRERKGLDGVTPISATPAYLLVGPELETLAEQVLSSIYAADVADVNPFAGKLRLLVEPRLSGNVWYVFSDPARLATIQHAYLSSAQGVQIQRQEAWNTLGLSFRAFLDFGAGWVDWRGAQKNPGV